MRKHHHHYHRHPHPLAIAALLFIAVAAITSALYGKKYVKRKGVPMLPDFYLRSSAFDPDNAIPAKYTCKGANASPPLNISGTPDGTISLALVLHDPDAPGGDYLHWTMWNINPNTADIPENKVPAGAQQGTNDFGDMNYDGPCPPSGTQHRYEFDLYALSSILSLPTGATRQEVMKAIKTHAIGRTQLAGTFSAD